MKSDSPVNLRITPEGIDAFCERLQRSSATPNRAVAGLAALQTFLAETAEPGEKASGVYSAVKERIAMHLEAASRAVIAEAAESLAEGIHQRAPAAVADVHRTLSRSGFHQAVSRAVASGLLESDSISSGWAAAWCSEAKRRAQAASGYPDAFDFSTAGIPFEQYTAMCDLRDSGRNPQ